MTLLIAIYKLRHFLGRRAIIFHHFSPKAHSCLEINSYNTDCDNDSSKNKTLLVSMRVQVMQVMAPKFYRKFS